MSTMPPGATPPATPAPLRKGTRVRVINASPALNGKIATTVQRERMEPAGFAYELELKGGARIWANDTQVEPTP